MTGEDLAVMITAVSLLTAQYLTVDELNILVAVFTQLADTYATLSVIRSMENSPNPSSSANSEPTTQEEDVIALETV